MFSCVAGFHILDDIIAFCYIIIYPWLLALFSRNLLLLKSSRFLTCENLPHTAFPSCYSYMLLRMVLQRTVISAPKKISVPNTNFRNLKSLFLMAQLFVALLKLSLTIAHSQKLTPQEVNTLKLSSNSYLKMRLSLRSLI
ncbi:hypothetical protein L6452_41957 [Arctium lappa]|uniref:Uncharacterized protein n=1 Tax=Arctium lappa TaxID=4217 RepID=A0ACB8XKZ5_ARCLA|nr:hypothetical protein L6452_41957 [Arctium lappa]